MFSGIVGGMYWANRGAPRSAVVGRGAQVADGAKFQVAAQRERNKALGRPDDKFPLTLAGVSVPFQDRAPKNNRSLPSSKNGAAGVPATTNRKSSRDAVVNNR